ncbi:hypothetical protein LOTGIDRAFT_154193 [Lottia gigantea]|uniref:Iron-sulfur clusters transporter ABCB7, mitochondrial n=1 Tax=Lottia gigantea TaxID=225164 RepID=V4A752_LOTGI|nr:hypothetical protein LOTGIDRAFT_154193 [Lottia gigantea]ESO89111.1 hypothetical protein LOTGIDRAFT_154193 [Lottia gigantea]
MVGEFPALDDERYKTFHHQRKCQQKKKSFFKQVFQKKSQKRDCACSHVEAIPVSSNKASADIKTVEVLKALGTHVWPKDEKGIKPRVVIALSLLVGGKVLNTCVPFVFKSLVDNLNTVAGNVYNMDTGANSLITVTTALVLGYGIARTSAYGFQELRNAVFSNVAQNSIRRVATKLFLHLHSLDLSFHLSKQTGSISTIIDKGTKGITTILTNMIFNTVPLILEVSLVAGILWYSCGLLYTSVAFSCVFAYGIFTFRFTNYRKKLRRQMNESEKEASAKVIDSLINYETVKYFNNELHELDKYDKYLKKYQEASLKTSKSLAQLNFGQNFIFTAGLVGVMYFASKEIISGTMTIGDLVMVNGLLFQLSVPLNFLGSSYRDLTTAITDMGNMFNILNQKSKVQNLPEAPLLNVTSQESDVVFNDVHFEYVPGQRILDGLSFSVPSGKKVAIVGGSGSGKTTLVRLLFRFFDPLSGDICINNQDILNVDINSLRQAIGVVPQDCVLLHDTIYYNIQYGDLTKSREEVIEAAKMAEIHETIDKRFPKQYDTQVGERGLKLSGGEKQRVAIARAILKDPKIIIYDEATSSLDTITEQNILRALKCITQGRTTIVIAHRLSTVVDADEILVLDKGTVVERGTHYSLLSNPDSIYTNLWLTQNISPHEALSDENNNKPSSSNEELPP